MAPVRVRASTSTFTSRVTLYEPTAASLNGSTSHSATSDVAIAPSPTRRRSNRLSGVKLEGDEEGELFKPNGEDDADEEKPTPKAKSPRKPKKHVEALDKPHPAPKRWEETYEVIRKQRQTIFAPVDGMGCEQGGRSAKKEGEDEPVESEKDKRLSIIVSLMLSSQTKDPVTHQATMNLRYQLPGGLTLEALEAATVEQIDQCICKVGFHNTKAKNLKLLAERLRTHHDGDVPGDLPSLLEIVGVGPKMAYLYLQATGQNIGIGVDTHVHRITNRLRWHQKETQTAEQTRLNLESWLPKHLWPSVNKMLVGFGQEICKPVGPRCDLCDVATAKLCPSRRVVVPSPKKKVKVEIEVKGEDGEPTVKVAMEEEEQKLVSAIKPEPTVPSAVAVNETVVKEEVVEATVA
ncbi:hypothetical protein BMF94_2545 [Rhodotorula taiwanensis]|uniref:Endonuclease III homolog n=1 Tax=Rhodotorula taiwanensis TaxID=741276 RepID=A0A2S5BC85_9BASI|nr:hypothetical protein BMF94_2545 [Rhodotorula taiwanensis]